MNICPVGIKLFGMYRQILWS